MDCMQAQEIISAALDNAIPAGAVLDQAKAHCRTCAQCNAFVKTLVAIKNAPAPEPPADLDERIMAAVLAEKDRMETETAILPAVPEAGIAPTELMPAVEPISTPDEIPLNPRLAADRSRFAKRRAALSWIAAAAVVLVAAGVGSVIGIRAMFGGNAPQEVTTLESTAADQNDAGTGQAAPPSTPTDQFGASPQQRTAQTGSFIVVNGSVYRSAGNDATVSQDSLTQTGTTRTSLISGGVPRDERVFSAGDPTRVFIASADGVMLAFDRVTTSFEGRTYVLRSDDIPEYGSLATLPDEIPEPTASDGFPAFDPLSGAASGVYVRSGQTAADGIAYPPGAKPDMSTGWTWWEPAQQPAP